MYCNTKPLELQTTKEILAEIFLAQSGEVKEIIQRRLEESGPEVREEGRWPTTFFLGEYPIDLSRINVIIERGEFPMPANTFDVIERRKLIIFFKLGKLWVFKQFFDNHELFNAFLDYYNKDLYRFEFKSIGARNNALKLLEKNGFDYDLVEDLKGYVVQLPKSAKYAQILKNSVAFKEAANERLFLMKDLATVEEAVGLGAKIYEGDISF
ncbi:MAG: hypothetical protein WCW68_01010 [Methanothrix sp.]